MFDHFRYGGERPGRSFGTEREGLGDLLVRRGKAWEIFWYGGGRPGRSSGMEGEGLGDLLLWSGKA